MKYAAPAEYSVHLCVAYSLSAGVGDVRRHGVFAVHDHRQRLAVVGLLERGLTADQHEEDYPQTPDICRDTDRTPSSACLCAHHIATFEPCGQRNGRETDQQS